MKKRKKENRNYYLYFKTIFNKKIIYLLNRDFLFNNFTKFQQLKVHGRKYKVSNRIIEKVEPKY